MISQLFYWENSWYNRALKQHYKHFVSTFPPTLLHLNRQQHIPFVSPNEAKYIYISSIWERERETCLGSQLRYSFGSSKVWKRDINEVKSLKYSDMGIISLIYRRKFGLQRAACFNQFLFSLCYIYFLQIYMYICCTQNVKIKKS